MERESVLFEGARVGDLRSEPLTRSRADFHGPNLAYVEELYESYRRDPASVDADARAAFASWQPETDGPPAGQAVAAQGGKDADLAVAVATANYAQAIRGYGHLAAQLDPLGSAPPGDPALEASTYGLDDAILRRLPASLVGGPVAERAANALEAIRGLREVYCAATGYDYEHLRDPRERAWLRDAAEAGRFCFRNDPIDPLALLERLTQVETFEHFLHRIFPGKTRFSLEGLDMLVPMLDEVIDRAAGLGAGHILIGMAHRGRLNVLAHVLNKPYAQILAEFRDPARSGSIVLRESLGWTGDVRYHAGAQRALQNGEPYHVNISMAPNPSHLEAVNPVIEGMARAAGTGMTTGAFDGTVALPILIHGDAAFPGQGVVAETLNLSRLPGYQTGGTIHLIANNQLGFTADVEDARSTLYASDLAKGFEIPIVHVNADDPEACIEAARLAIGYRAEFHKDFLIDLIGYRRYGHNEGDEPGFTQPLMYERIAQHPGAREQWARKLVAQQALPPERPGQLVNEHMNLLQGVLSSLQPERDLVEPQSAPPPAGAARRVKTAVPSDRLRELNEQLLSVPDGFNVNPKLERVMRRRRQALAEPDSLTIDWGAAEQLALASILEDGIAIRLSGEDTARGTFGHRHAVLHDVKNGRTFTPLQALPRAKAIFEVYDSPLSENAAVGFEYGYNVQAPGRLVIWEAQYGDFVNGAQVMIDEFVMPARAKWGQTPSLVLLLPHGFEGQGPDHSSGRLERFLNLAAETNARIAYPTTAGQYFHLLRRQALLLETDPLPLVVMTPKSLLRHPSANSSLRDLAEGRWQAIIDDPAARGSAAEIERLILCSGKVHVDLVSSELREQATSTAIVRVEQLYPFPGGELQNMLRGYPNLGEVIWLQEEPENMGAWTFARPRLEALIDGRWPLRYVGRPANASPAEGSSTWHTANQAALIEQALGVHSDGARVLTAERGVRAPSAG
jgi:2-oxoglutarate dehydrogenase E1 component